MGVKKGSLEETKVESEMPESKDTSSVKSSYFGSKGVPSSSASSSDDDQPDAVKNASGNGTVMEDIRKPRLADLEENGVYDREAILHHLANLTRPGNGGEIFSDIIRLNESSLRSEMKIPDCSSKIEADKKLTVEDRHYLVVDELRETLKAVPDSLLLTLTGWVRPGDCGRPADQKPDWLNMEKLKKGQKFARDNMFAVMYVAIVGLLPVFSFDDELTPLIITGNTTTPFAAFKRYLSTGLKLRRWYTQDIWDKGSGAWKDISIARAMHTATRRRLVASTNEEIDAATAIPNANCPTREIMTGDLVQACEAPAVGQCPYVVGHGNRNRPKGLNQANMELVQWSFAGLIVSYPQRFGVHHATDEDLEAFCHLWRSLGYQMGIEEEYNFFRGTLEDIRQRSSELIDTWVKPNFREMTPKWEHMSRSLVAAVASLLPGITFEMVVLHLMETLDLPMPRLYASLSFVDRFLYNLITGFLHYGMKVPGVSSLVNAVTNLMMNQAAKYTPGQLESLRIKLGG